MYLTKKSYVKNWNHMADSEKYKITVLKGNLPSKNIKPERISHIQEDVAYWRKANAIHNWFVENVQNGKDNCAEYYVSKKQLEELLNLCYKVRDNSNLQKGVVKNGYTIENGVQMPILEEGKEIEDETVANILLPTKGGFFFGSTDYDEYYMQDIEDTIKQLEPLLEEEGNFYYSSSW